MAFLDEVGLAELWARVIAKDNAIVANEVKFASGSYNGTGKYGSANPNSLTFSFVPKMICIVGYEIPSEEWKTDSGVSYTDGIGENKKFGSITEIGFTTDCTTSYAAAALWKSAKNYNYGPSGSTTGGGWYYNYAKKSSDGKTVSWYHPRDEVAQFNESNKKYYYFALGH